MDPLLVTAIGSIGSRLIDRIFPAPQAPQLDAASIQQFSELIGELEGMQSNQWTNYLQEQGITSWEELEQHLQGLQKDFEQQLESQFPGFSTDSGNWTLQMDSGQYQVTNPQGSIISLEQYPGMQQLAGEVHHLSMLQLLHSQSPDASLSQVTGRYSPQAQSHITWNL